jgi:apolipoprotein N-acyltransferase
MAKAKLTIYSIPARILWAVLGGGIASLAWPADGFWPAIFVGLPLLWFSIRHLGFWSAHWIGLIGGFAFYCIQLPWLSIYLGPVPWLALSLLEAIIFAIGMAVTALVWRLASRFGTLASAAALATVWVSREWASTHLPYGGFPWSTLAQTQSESPLAKWVYWGGFDLLSFVVAFISAIVLLGVLDLSRKMRLPSSSKTAAVRSSAVNLGAVAICLAIPLATTPPTGAEAGNLTFAAVQGNANAGLFSNDVPGSILDKHVAATDKLSDILAQRGSGAPKPSVIIWPENSADLSPLYSGTSAAKVRGVIDKFKLPLILGTYRFDSQNNVYNTSLFYGSDGNLLSHYDKQRPVPFAEYVPDRDFWYSIAPDLVGLITHGYSAGHSDGIYRLGNAKLGIEICFEIAIGEVSHSTVDHGAQVLIVQTNSADFGHSAEMYQQAAFAKLRAIETGRALISVSTVGVSAVYAPDGRVIETLPEFAPGVMLQSVPLRTSQTPAFWLNSFFVTLFNLGSLLMFALALLAVARKRQSAKKLESPN